jgi:ribosomal protein S1
MIGTNVICTVIAQANSRNISDASMEPNGVVVQLPDGAKGFLHISRMVGKTPEDRAVTLAEMTAGSQLNVDVVSETTIGEEPGYRVNQWSAVRKSRVALADRLRTEKLVVIGSVRRLDEQYAIINLVEGLQGLLHVSRVAGNSDEEKAARLAALAIGDSINVEITEVSEVSGRTRVRLAELVA